MTPEVTARGTMDKLAGALQERREREQDESGRSSDRPLSSYATARS